MKKLMKRKWFWCCVFAFLFIAGAVIYEIVMQPEEVSIPIGEAMMACPETVLEHREADGTITTYVVNGDPVFHGQYPHIYNGREQEPSDREVDQTDWVYRVTYHIGGHDVDSVEFLFGYHWFSQDGVVYDMHQMWVFPFKLDGLFAYYAEDMFYEILPQA